METLTTRAAGHLILSAILWTIMIAAVMVDLWDRCYTERRLRRPVTSRRLRKTIAKVLEYWRLMLLGFLVDTAGLLFPWYGAPYLSAILCVALVAVEAKSMWEHARERRSAAVGLAEVSRAIVECASQKDVREVIRLVSQWLEGKGGVGNGKN